MTTMDIDDIINQHAVYTLFGDIDGCVSEDFIRFAIAHNLNKKQTQAINLLLSTPGGNLTSAFAIIDIMQSSRIPIHTWALGEISSGGLMIFMAGTQGNRNIAPNCHIMSHQFTGSYEGKSHELASAHQDFNLTSQRVLQHYLKCTNLPQEAIMQQLLPPHDVYLTPQQAMSMGIADRIKCYE
jgi:ATP-dependent Clp protease protease subunit